MKSNMIITKSNIDYTVNEQVTGWTLTASLGGISVSYNISKADCPTFEALKKFVAESDAI